MDKNIVAAMVGILAAMLINSMVLYQAKLNQSVECYLQTNKGSEVHVRVGYSQPSSSLLARKD